MEKLKELIKNNRKKVISGCLLVIALVGFLFFHDFERINVQASLTNISQNQDFLGLVGTLEIDGKVKKHNVFNNATEHTLFNMGSGIQDDISTDLHEQDYTFIKGHRETTMLGLERVQVGDIVELTRVNGTILKYEVYNIYEAEFGRNQDIYTYTDEVSITLITCSWNSKSNMNPEIVLVVNARLVE